MSPGRFSVISGSRPDSLGGGNGRHFFRLLQVIFYISDSKTVTISIHCRKKTFTKSLGGGMNPVPPLATPLDDDDILIRQRSHYVITPVTVTRVTPVHTSTSIV